MERIIVLSDTISVHFDYYHYSYAGYSLEDVTRYFGGKYNNGNGSIIISRTTLGTSGVLILYLYGGTRNNGMPAYGSGLWCAFNQTKKIIIDNYIFSTSDF